MSDTTDFQVDATNTEQLRAWDGTEGDYWAAHANQYDSAVDGYHQPLLDLAAITPDDAVLDIGCGTGQTTRDAARLATAGSALGIDLSARMLDVARAKADQEGLDNVSFEQGDAQIHGFAPASFDVALSRTGSMFFGDPTAAHANIARALRPGGRLALAVWQPMAENEWFTSFVGALSPLDVTCRHRPRTRRARSQWAILNGCAASWPRPASTMSPSGTCAPR